MALPLGQQSTSEILPTLLLRSALAATLLQIYSFCPTAPRLDGAAIAVRHPCRPPGVAPREPRPASPLALLPTVVLPLPPPLLPPLPVWFPHRDRCAGLGPGPGAGPGAGGTLQSLGPPLSTHARTQDRFPALRGDK